MRKQLILNPNIPKDLMNADLMGAERVIFDLKTSVLSAQKEEARYLLKEAFSFLPYSGVELWIRLNEGTQGLADLEVLNEVRADGFILAATEVSEFITMYRQLPEESKVYIEMTNDTSVDIVKNLLTMADISIVGFYVEEADGL